METEDKADDWDILDLREKNCYEVSVRINAELAKDVQRCLVALKDAWKELQIIKERAEHESKSIEHAVQMLRKYYPFGEKPPWEEKR